MIREVKYLNRFFHFSFYFMIVSYVNATNYNNVIPQVYSYSCATASLGTILKFYYGINITEKKIYDDIMSEVIEKELKKEKGFSFYDLFQYCIKYNFKPLVLKVNLKNLKNLKVPVIMHLKKGTQEHFVVYRGMNEKRIFLADPSLGNIVMEISKFKTLFYINDNSNKTGTILAILPTKMSNVSINRDFMETDYNFVLPDK